MTGHRLKPMYLFGIALNFGALLYALSNGAFLYALTFAIVMGYLAIRYRMLGSRTQ